MTGLVQTLSTYWNGRTGREQSALLLLAIVLTGTVGYFGVIAPIRSFHLDARREYTAAANAYLEVMADLERWRARLRRWARNSMMFTEVRGKTCDVHKVTR